MNYRGGVIDPFSQGIFFFEKSKYIFVIFFIQVIGMLLRN